MPPSSIPVDRGGFLTLFEELKDPMYRFLYRLSRDAHDAEDLLQDTFATLWRKRDQFRGEGSVAGYVRKIAYRTYLNARPRLVRRKSERPIDADPSARDGAPDEWVARSDERARRLESVKEAVEALPAGWREPFVLFRYEGLTCAEIAECLGVTPKAVELRLARALKAVSSRVLGIKAAPGGSGSAA